MLAHSQKSLGIGVCLCLVSTTSACEPLPRKTWESMCICKLLSDSVWCYRKAASSKMLSHACRLSAYLSTLCETASKVLEFPSESLCFTYTGVIVMCRYTIAVFNRYKKYSHKGEGIYFCNLTSLKRAEEYLDCTSKQQNNFAATLRMCVCT